MFKFSSDWRKNRPKSQTQNVVVAKLTTVLQKVQVTDRSRSPPHRANKEKISDYQPSSIRFPSTTDLSRNWRMILQVNCPPL